MARPQPKRFRVVPRIDTWPSAVAFVQRPLGKLAVLGLFALGLWWHGEEWWLDATLVLAALSAWPSRRRPLLLAGTWFWLTRHTWFNWQLIDDVARREGVSERIAGELFAPSLVLAALLFCAAFHYAVRRFGESRFARRPILTLLSTYVALILVAGYAPLGGFPRTVLWGFLVVLGRYLWYLGYSLLDRRAGGTREVALHFGHYLPFWIGTSGSPTPWPKGSAYLRKTEAKSAAELAVSQLKGLKLLAWAGILVGVHQILIQLVHDWAGPLPRWLGMTITLDLPSFDEVFARSLDPEGAPYAWYLGWAALVVKFLSGLLDLAVWGHVMIATCRMAGFNVLRNTYRPLESATIAEFWNRYYYYFKELLVDFFFYPTYLRYLRKRPRLRLFFATLVAAGFGNVLYHFLRDVQYIIQLGPWEALLAFRAYVFYGLLLGTAIGLSQLRGRSAPSASRTWLRRRVLAPFAVLTFYCVLSVFDDPDRSLTLGDHFHFLLTLVGIS